MRGFATRYHERDSIARRLVTAIATDGRGDAGGE
jgi:hypothetical protein